MVGAASVFSAAALAAPRTGWATIKGPQNRGQDQKRDGHSRHEDRGRAYVPITTSGGSFRVQQLVLIQTRFVYVSNTSLGVDYESLDKVDMSEVPLFGEIFNRAVGPEDFTDETRIGAVFQAGSNGLAAVISDEIDVEQTFVQIVNGKGIYSIRMQPRILEVAPTELGEFGALESVEVLLSGRASEDMTVAIGGLTPGRDPDIDGNKVPILGDVPMLKTLFRGTVHEGENSRLHIMVRPSIIMGDETS